MASTSNENIISNLSYTEKDFQTIYPALLDLVKKETSKWDPSASNESDPGVLLLKLNALIADKCNYNVDKNVLECFPLSVTQEPNARQLFEQLGYYMHWYKGADTIVSMKYLDTKITDTDGNPVLYDIPRFTMVCDDEAETVYTIVDRKTLSTDGTIQTFYAIQGVAVDLEINGSKLITTANLDSNNRVYFTDTKIAENGIYITNADAENYTDWKKKDNLLVEQVSADNKFYKFGVTQDLNTCYLEFPENAEELFQDGINVTYIRTNGSDGNVAPYVIEAFYKDLVIQNPLSDNTDDTVILNTDNVSVKNYINGVDGDEPETINDAYLNYKRTVGTFKTLITLRDYMNAVRESEYVSNAIASDRTSDIQVSYDIMTQSGSVSQLMNEIEMTTEYVDGYYIDGDFYEDEAQTLYIDPSVDKNYRDITKDSTGQPKNTTYRVIYENKDYRYIEADGVERPAMNAFNLKLYLLSATSLMKNATYYNKTFTLNTDEGTDMVVKAEINDYQCVQHDFADILLDRICFFKNKYPLDCTIIPQYTLTEAQKTDVMNNIRQALWKNLNAAKVEFGQELIYEDIYNLIINADSRIKAIGLKPLTYTTYVVYLTKDSNEQTVVKELDISKVATIKNSEGKQVLDKDSLINKFRTEIYAKSVLAGKTQFFVKDSKFNYGINQRYQLLEDNIGRLDTGLNVTLNADNEWQYPTRTNEVIELYAPNLIEYASFSSNIRFEYCLNSTVAADSSYALQVGEFIIFYWTDESTVDSGYNYAVYGKGSIIKPSFTLDKPVPITSLVGQVLTNEEHVHPVTINNQTYLYATGCTANEPTGTDLYDKIKAMTATQNILSGNRSVKILLTNSITLDSSSYYCYWVLNEQENGEYVLFDKDAGYEPRLLRSGEYFIYTDPTKSDMAILGAGTQIRRLGSIERLACTAIDYSEIVSQGLLALVDYWVQLPADYILTVAEMQYMAFSSGSIVQIKPNDTSVTEIKLNSTDPVTLGNHKIRYKESATATEWIDVPRIVLGDDSYTWNALTLLRLDLSVSKSQVFYNGQTITYYRYDLENKWVVTEAKRPYYTDEQWELVKPGTIDPSVAPFNAETYLLTSRLINDIGPSIYTVETDSNDQPVPLSIYGYVNGTMDEDIQILEDSTTNILFRNDPHREQEKTITFKLPAGNYIMPVSHTTDDKLIDELYITLSPYTYNLNDSLNSMIFSFPNTVNINRNGIYEVPLVVKSEDSYQVEQEGGGYITKYVTTVKGYADGIKFNNSAKTITLINYRDSGVTGTDTIVYRSGGWVNAKYKIWQFKSTLKTGLEPLSQWLLDNNQTISKELSSMGGTDSNNLYKANNYYLRIDDLADSKQSDFFVTIKTYIKYTKQPGSKSLAPVISIIIPPIFKYFDSSSLNDDADLNAELFVNIYEKIKALDFNHLYDYTYVINGDTEIKDPLNCASFLNTNHIMNPYTICQLDTANTDIYITNTARN